MRDIALLTMLGIAACRSPSPDEAIDRIEVLANQACACTTVDCISPLLDDIGDLAEPLTADKIGLQKASRALGGWTHAMHCHAKLELDARK